MNVLEDTQETAFHTLPREGLSELHSVPQHSQQEITYGIAFIGRLYAKETFDRVKEQPTEWEKISISYASNRGFLFKCINKSKY